MLQIAAALFYYKLGKTLLQIGPASLLQIGASAVTNWGNYYKLGQPLLQNRAAIITKWDKIYYKLGYVLQIRTIITNWGIKNTFEQQQFFQISHSISKQYLSFLKKIVLRILTFIYLRKLYLKMQGRSYLYLLNNSYMTSRYSTSFN